MEFVKDQSWDRSYLIFFINDLNTQSRSVPMRFSHDTKVGGIINTEKDQNMYEDLDDLVDWSNEMR